MALNFPLNPSNGTVYVGPNGITYVYDFTNGYWIVQSESVSINDNAVTTSKIADDAVTGLKIADGAVTPAKLDRTYVEPLVNGSIAGYQQGSGTPYAVDVSNPGVDGVTAYTQQTMRWSRIGNTVFFNLYLEAGDTWGTKNGVTESSVFGINGLPYEMVAGSASGYPGCTVSFWSRMNFSINPVDAQNLGQMLSWLDDNPGMGPSVRLGLPTYSSSGQNVNSLVFEYSFWKTRSALQIHGQYTTIDTTWVPLDGATLD